MAQTLHAQEIGSAELQPGQTLDTQIGNAEILLTPGAFLRLGDNSSVTMISPSLTDTEVRLDKGRATVEVAELHPQNNLIVVQHGDTERLLKTGLYDFDADRNLFRVYEGEAVVRQGNRDITVKGSISSCSAPADRRKPRNSTKNGLRTISTAGAACGPRIPRKPTLIGLKLIRWAAGTLRVGIGIRISAVTPTFRETESSTARSAGVSIRPISLVGLHLATMAISTIISIPTGIAGAEVTVIITLLTTITASIMALAAMDIAASIMEQMAARTGA